MCLLVVDMQKLMFAIMFPVPHFRFERRNKKYFWFLRGSNHDIVSEADFNVGVTILVLLEQQR